MHPEFIADQSDVENDHFVFAHTMTIRNTGTVPAQLIAHWIITDAEDKGAGSSGPRVVGHQPLLRQARSFDTFSGCALPTPVGTMPAVATR